MVAFRMSSRNASPRRVKGYGFPPSKGGPMFYAENYVGFQKQRGGKGRRQPLGLRYSIWLVVWLPFFIFPYIELLIIPID